MKWPLFENKIKDELSGHRSEVDIDALWSTIEPEVDAINKTKQKRRFGIIWFLFAGALLLGSGAAFYFLNNDEAKNATVISENVLDDKTENEKNSESNANANTETKTIEKISNKKEPNLEKNDQNNTAKNSGLNKAPENYIDLKSNKKLINKNSVAKENKEKIKSILKDKPVANAGSINDDQISDLEKLASDQSFENIVTTDANGQTLSQYRSSELIEKIGTLGLPPFKTTSNLPQVQILPLREKSSKSTTSIILSDDKRHPMGKKDFRFSIGANAGISYATRKLSTNIDSVNALIELREETEKQLETSHFGLQLNLRHKTGFEISSGLQYTRIVEYFEYFKNITETDSVLGIKYFAVNPNNDTFAVTGMVPHTKTIDIRKRYYNRYTMLDIPLMVGYFKENDNWSYGAQAGVFANISLKTEGQFLNDATTTIDIKDLFESNVGLSYYLGISAGYQLNNNIEVGISPYFRYFPKNFAKDNYSISQKYTLFGLDVRFRYWF